MYTCIYRVCVHRERGVCIQGVEVNLSLGVVVVVLYLPSWTGWC